MQNAVGIMDTMLGSTPVRVAVALGILAGLLVGLVEFAEHLREGIGS